jgi:hypothetical protein
MGLDGIGRKLTGNSEVNQNHLVGALSQNNILRLNIPVQQALPMDDLQGCTNLTNVMNGNRFRQWAIGLWLWSGRFAPAPAMSVPKDLPWRPVA